MPVECDPDSDAVRLVFRTRREALAAREALEHELPTWSRDGEQDRADRGAGTTGQRGAGVTR
jgi:hypothetical protein